LILNTYFFIPLSKHNIFVETILEWLGSGIWGIHDHIIQQRPTTMFGNSKEDCEIKRQNMKGGNINQFMNIEK